MNKGPKALKVVSDHISRLDRTIENLNVRQEYRSPDSPYANSASFTMARMAQSGLSNEDIAYAFVLPVEDVEASIKFTKNYQDQCPRFYNHLMGNTLPIVIPPSDSFDDGLDSDPFVDDDGALVF